MKNNFGTVKVKCFDGKKFSFSDTLDVCKEWVSKLSTCGGLVSYLWNKLSILWTSIKKLFLQK